MENTKYKIIAFDLDGTLTQHKSLLEQQNKEILEYLSDKYKTVIIGAGSCARIAAQLNGLEIDIVGNYGMERSTFLSPKTFQLLKSEKYEVNREFFLRGAEKIREKYKLNEYVGDSVEFHASGAVTFPILGTAAALADKLVYDPNRKKRRVMFEDVCLVFKGYNCFIGGTSSFDIVKSRYDKYHALLDYALEFGVSKKEILFVGDDFGLGGNDSHVAIGGIDFVDVPQYNLLEESLRKIDLIRE